MKLDFIKIFSTTNKNNHSIKKQVQIIKKSPFFDAKWYLEQYPDVNQQKINPARHYVKYGWKEYRNPGPNFNTQQYLLLYSDLLEKNICPLYHQIINNNIFQQTHNIFQKVNIISQENYNLIANSKLFDKDWYITQNIDVKKSGIDPIQHYILYGNRNNIQRNPSIYFSNSLYLKLYPNTKNKCPLLEYEKNKQQDIEDIDILYINFLQPTDGVSIWRVDFVEEFLQKNKFKIKTENINNPSDKFFSRLYSAKIIIATRPSYSNEIVREVIPIIKSNKKIFIIDCDDLLIPEYSYASGSYKSNVLKLNETQNFNKSYLNIFYHADYFIVSTKFLKNVFQNKFHKKCIVHNNRISTKFISNKEKSKSNNEFKILYASGSPSHDYDASSIFLDLVNFCNKHKKVHITILGTSNLGLSLSKMHNNCTIIPKVSYDEMIKIFSKHDLLLVPLDKNPFNEAKSNIKYIEAGAVCTPVLAKDCTEFKENITDNDTGFIYCNDFYEKLEQIYKSRKILTKIGYNAQQDIIHKHTTQYPNYELVDFLRSKIC